MYLKYLKVLNSSKFFELSTAPTRGHSLKIVEPRCRLDVRKFSSAHRVVDIWNSLEDRIVACEMRYNYSACSSYYI